VSMRQLVMMVALAATGVAALAVAGMIGIALVHDHDATPTVLNNLQTIALLIVTAVAGVVQHYMGAGGQAQTSQPPAVNTPKRASTVPHSAPGSDAGEGA
jgi:hypothetical protein